MPALPALRAASCSAACCEHPRACVVTSSSATMDAPACTPAAARFHGPIASARCIPRHPPSTSMIHPPNPPDAAPRSQVARRAPSPPARRASRKHLRAAAAPAPAATQARASSSTFPHLQHAFMSRSPPPLNQPPHALYPPGRRHRRIPDPRAGAPDTHGHGALCAVTTRRQLPAARGGNVSCGDGMK